MRACQPLFLLFAAFVLCLTATAAAAMPMPFPRLPRHAPALPASRLLDPTRPGTANCSERFFTQKLDHFTFNSTQTYEQRYFLCHANGTNWAPNGTVFFYTGNECDITLFVNMTGLMWENAVRFNAVLVFAEHRYFGKSLPYPGEPMPTGAKLQYLTTDQAMADYSTLINYLRFEADSAASPVIAFGGSYGGMLAAWMRIKYPDVIDGSIAASAPIVNFEYMDPKYPADAFNEAVTFDATPAGGSKAGCAENVRQSWQDMVTLGATTEGRATLDKVLMMCEPLNSMSDVDTLMNSAVYAFAFMAMSSYPFPSSYLLLGGRGVMPAYPMRVGCEFAGGNFSTPEERLAGFMKMILVYYNATGDFKCLNPTSTVNKATEIFDYLWDYLFCTTLFMPCYGHTGTTDMFWSAPWNATARMELCRAKFDITPQPEWVKIQYGGWGVSRWGSNIFFSNGALDPWRPGGITHSVAPNITAHIIPDMGHHVDLMFSDPHDTPAIRETREMEMRHVERWVAEKRAQWGM